MLRWITRSRGHAPLHVVPAHSLHSTGGTWWLFLSHLRTSFCSLSTRWRTSAWAGKKHVCLLVFIYFLPRCTCALLVLYPPPAFGSLFVFFSHISLRHMGRFRFMLSVAAVGVRFRPGIYTLLKEGVYLMSPHPSLLQINIRCGWAALSDTSCVPSLSLFPPNSRGFITVSAQWFISLQLESICFAKLILFLMDMIVLI